MDQYDYLILIIWIFFFKLTGAALPPAKIPYAKLEGG